MTDDLTPVKSSNVEAIGHDANANELTVKYRSGGSYVYSAIAADQHKALMSVDSNGRESQLDEENGAIVVYGTIGGVALSCVIIYWAWRISKKPTFGCNKRNN